MKSDKGMGYIPVIIIIIVVAILVAAGVYFIRIKLNEEKIETLKTNMLLIQWKARNYVDTKKAAKEEVTYVGTKVSEIQDNSLISEWLEKDVITEEEYEKYYVLNDEDLKSLSSEVLNEEGSYYLVNYDTYEIVITKGCYYNEDEILYKLSDIERGALEKEETIEENVEEVEENKEEPQGE